MKKISISMLLIFVMFYSSTGHAALVGTELSIETLYQDTSTSEPVVIGFLTTATVSNSIVEYPSLKDLETDVGNLVDVSINAGDNFLEIDFDNVTSGSFASGYFNGYVFTFDSDVAVIFSGAAIDTSLTTLGLVSTDLSFSGNQLFVNVEGLSFNTSTFARINLGSSGGLPQVPIPAGIWLLGSGLLGLLGANRFSKSKP